MTEPSPYAKHLAKHGGIANTGGHLGVIIGTMPATEIPAGWIYCPLAAATPEIVQSMLDQARLGRAAWPEKEAPYDPAPSTNRKR